MLQIPEYGNVYRTVGQHAIEEQLGCGVMHKTHEVQARRDFCLPNHYVGCWVDDACWLLEQNLGQRLPLNEVAAELHLGYETFRKVFRAELGMSPSDFQGET